MQADMIEKLYQTDSHMPLSIPVLTGRRHHRDDGPITIGDALNNLSEEQKKQLREKYDITSIAPNSDEYWNLMADLCGMGIISNIPDQYFGKIVTYVKYGEDGFARGSAGYDINC